MALVLASKSSARSYLLKISGLSFSTVAPRIDETSISSALSADGATPRDISDALAEYKARKVSEKYLDDLVIGSDQVLSFQGRVFGKPESREDLRHFLKQIANQRHQLFTACVLYKAGKPLWRHVARTDLVLRSMDNVDLDNYIANHWDTVQHCAGGYAFENTPHIFESVRGNWHDILGLPLTQLLAALRNQGHNVRGNDPKIAAVLGHPISHSKSPILHRHWLAKNEISGDYIPIDIPPIFFKQTIRNLANVGFAGFNVTIPHKLAALELADQKTETAARIEASNTLFVNKGQISADNTDGYGFYQNLVQSDPTWDVTAGPALVLGAGGASRSVIDVLLCNGAPKIYLTNRTRETAESLAYIFGEKVEVVEWDKKSDYVKLSKTIVNTTSLGMIGKPELNIDISDAQSDTMVTDLVYTPLETTLLKSARELGLKTVDGLGMLLHQAAPGFAGWFGPQPDIDDELRQKVLS